MRTDRAVGTSTHNPGDGDYRNQLGHHTFGNVVCCRLVGSEPMQNPFLMANFGISRFHKLSSHLLQTCRLQPTLSTPRFESRIPSSSGRMSEQSYSLARGEARFSSRLLRSLRMPFICTNAETPTMRQCVRTAHVSQTVHTVSSNPDAPNAPRSCSSTLPWVTEDTGSSCGKSLAPHATVECASSSFTTAVADLDVRLGAGIDVEGAVESCRLFRRRTSSCCQDRKSVV